MGGVPVLTLIKTLGADSVFDPETIEILVEAFYIAWRSVETSGAPFVQQTYREAARELLAKSIIEGRELAFVVSGNHPKLPYCT